MRVETVYMGYEHEVTMMVIEEHTDPTQGMMLTGFELDGILELTRRLGQLMDVAMMFGREREERLVKRIRAKQDEWDRALREVFECASSL